MSCCCCLTLVVVAALHALLLSVAVFGVLVWLGVPVTYVYHKYLQVITTAVLSAFLLSVGLYIHSFYVAPEHLALGGNSGELGTVNMSLMLGLFYTLN